MIADYTWNGSTESPARQYVNGTQYIDERVVMRDIAAGGKDYYYLHEELYSVAGMAASNGMLKEAVVYDTYGEATLYKWLPGDIDRDGSVDLGDLSTLLSQFGSSGPGLSGDLDRDGDVDLGDLATLLSHFGVICT